MPTIDEMLQGVYRRTPQFAAQLEDLKKQNPQVAWYPFRSMEKVNLIARVASYFERVTVNCQGERPRIADIGTADGDVAFLFEAQGCEVVAVDNAPSNFNRCAGFRAMHELLHSKVTFLEKDIDYDFNVDGQYDLVLFLDILYHLRNPLGILLSLCQFGQYMIFTTKLFDSLPGGKSVRDLPYAYLLEPFEAAANDPTNYWVFTERALERLLDRGGWRILNKGYFGYAGNDATPFEPQRDKRIVALCERMEGYERLKYGHFIGG